MKSEEAIQAFIALQDVDAPKLLERIHGKMRLEIERLKHENRELRKELEWRDAMEPRPCNGQLYEGWVGDDYMAKIKEEVKELEKAYKEYVANGGKGYFYYRQMMREATDIKTVVTSFQERFGCNAKERRLFQFSINQSNALRDDGKRFKE